MKNKITCVLFFSASLTASSKREIRLYNNTPYALTITDAGRTGQEGRFIKDQTMIKEISSAILFNKTPKELPAGYDRNIVEFDFDKEPLKKGTGPYYIAEEIKLIGIKKSVIIQQAFDSVEKKLLLFFNIGIAGEPVDWFPADALNENAEFLKEIPTDDGSAKYIFGIVPDKKGKLRVELDFVRERPSGQLPTPTSPSAKYIVFINQTDAPVKLQNLGQYEGPSIGEETNAIKFEAFDNNNELLAEPNTYYVLAAIDVNEPPFSEKKATYGFRQKVDLPGINATSLLKEVVTNEGSRLKVAIDRDPRLPLIPYPLLDPVKDIYENPERESWASYYSTPTGQYTIATSPDPDNVNSIVFFVLIYEKK